jgi:hypothetical protein
VHRDLLSFAYLKHFIEKDAVMHNCFSELLGIGFAAFIARRDRLRCPVILNDGRVVDRDIGRTAFEIGHGVAALKHQLANQFVCLDDNPRGAIDEAALQGVPGVAEPSGVSGRQWCDTEVLHALLASLEFRFGLRSPS